MKRTIALLLMLTALSAGTIAIAGDSTPAGKACPANCTSCSHSSCPVPGCGLCN